MSIINEEVMTTFKSVPHIVKELFAEIPVELLDNKKSAEKWSIREHLYHIVDVQKMLQGRMVTIRDEEVPVIKGFNPENETALSEKFGSVEKALTALKNFRKTQLELIQNLSDDILRKTAEHNEYSSYSIPILVKHMIYHEYWHMYEIEDLWLSKG